MDASPSILFLLPYYVLHSTQPQRGVRTEQAATPESSHRRLRYPLHWTLDAQARKVIRNAVGDA